MSGIATALSNAYFGAPMFSLPDAADAFGMRLDASASDISVGHSFDSQFQGDAFEGESQSVMTAVKERPDTASLKFLCAPREHHAMVVKKQGQPVSLPDPMAVRVNDFPESKKERRNYIAFDGKGHIIGGANFAVLWCLAGSMMLSVEVDGDDAFRNAWPYVMLGGNVAAHMLFALVNSLLTHQRNWVQLLGKTVTRSRHTALHEQHAMNDVSSHPIMEQVLGSDISQKEYLSALSVNLHEWNTLNPVEQGTYLRADRRSGLDVQEEPIVLQSHGTPVSVGFHLRRLLERFHGLGDVGAQQELKEASSELKKWHEDYRVGLEARGNDDTDFRTNDTQIPEMAIGVKLADIPTAQRALRGVSRKQYERMIKGIIKQWETLNPIQRGTLHIADRLMGIAMEEHSIDLSPNWWTISPSFVVKEMVERLGMKDVFTDGAPSDSALWYRRYSECWARAATHPIDVTVKKGVDSLSAISVHLLQIPEIRRALLNVSMKEYRTVVSTIVGDWSGMNVIARKSHLNADRKSGFLSDIDQMNVVSPGFIAQRFCERYLGIGENAVRKQFKLDAKVRKDLESWYTSYLSKLNGGNT